jgi:hypothetical protein
MDVGQIFFLPVLSRPADFLPAKIKGNYWHTGIVFDGRVYETFNEGRHSIKPAEQRMKELATQNAEFVHNVSVNTEKLESEILSGTSCGEYVARVIGMSNDTGPKKTHWPQDVYDYLKNNGGKNA